MIFINCHEPKDLAVLLSEKLGESCICVKNFSPGDFVIGDVGIERKTITDFFSSLLQNRLFDQLSRLRKCYIHSFLILEVFDLSFFANPNVVYGTLLKILFDLDVKVIFSHSLVHTANILYLVHRKYNCISPVSNSNICSIPKSLYTKRSLHHTKLALLSTIPHVGPKTANSLLNHFGSLIEIFSAKPSKLRKVRGVGKKVSKSIKKLVE